MARVRLFEPPDLDDVAGLHRLVFGARSSGAPAASERYREYFTQVFLEDAPGGGAVRSLVYEEDDGRVTGFLGVVPRRMTLDGHPVCAAVSSQFIVDPTARKAIVAVQLAKTFLDGPQQLSIADEATDAARRIWEALGGTTALLHSLYWTRPLRPAQLALSFLRNRASLAPLAMAAGLPSRLVDTLATRLPYSHLHQTRPSVEADALECQTCLEHLPAFGRASLRVDYDAPTFAALLTAAARRRPDGRFRAAAIRRGGEVVGWHLYDLGLDGIAEVLQVAAAPSSIGAVLDHLFYSAWREGASAVAGRLDPRFMQVYSDKYCLFHRRGPWVLVHARRPEFVRPFQSGDAFFTRLDGEWCLGF
jgi:hypothetical protein